MASKRSVQTPQREWFRKELMNWVRERIDRPVFWQRGWVDAKAGRQAMEGFFRGEGDNSFFLWQWINLEFWAEQFLDAPVEPENNQPGCCLMTAIIGCDSFRLYVMCETGIWVSI